MPVHNLYNNCLRILCEKKLQYPKLHFQYFVIDSQLQKEKMAAKAAQLVPEERILIICDRGVLDNKAYVSQKEFDQILGSFSLTEDMVLKS